MNMIIGGTPESQFQQIINALEKSGLTVRNFTSLQDFKQHSESKSPTQKSEVEQANPAEKTLISMGDQFDAETMEKLMNSMENVPVLLVYSRPEYVLQQALQQGDDLEAQIGRWEHTAQAVLKTFKKYRSRTILIHGPTALSLPNELAELCRSRLKISCNEDQFHADAEAPEISSLLPRTIAAQWLASSRELLDLNGELEACAIPLGDAPPEFSPCCREASQEYRQLTKQLQELDQAKASLAKLQQEKKSGTQKRKEVEEENELLLQQLHQVQEELESYYLENKNHKDKLAEKDQQIEKNQQERSTLQKKLKTAETTLSEKQKEITAVKSKLKEAEKALAAEKKKREAASTEAAEAVKTRKQLQKQLDDIKKKGTQSDTHVKEVEEENELLLLQLHQVQEELESYYLEAKSLREGNTSISNYELTELAEYAKALEKKYIMLLDSRTWKIMAPVRESGRLLKSAIRRKRVPRNRFPNRPDVMNRIVGKRPAKRKGK